MTSVDAGRASTAGGASSIVEAALAFAERSHARASALLIALCLICFLPGSMSLQPMDRDEPRFAQASKQMLDTGDFIDIRFQDEARHKKPIGIYWAQSAVVAAAETLGARDARGAIVFYRIPSLIGALAAVLLTYWVALAFLSRRGAILAAGLFAACLMLSAEARLAKTDALLAACSVAAMGALARAWLMRATRPDASNWLVFWLAIAVGILVKGPMTPLFVGLAALALCLRERSAAWLLALRPGLGLALTLILVAPWFIAITLKSGGAFYEASVGEDMLAKVASGRDKHWAPPGTYALAFFATFWPGAAFAALAIPFAWAKRRSDAVFFLLAWIVPAWIVFEAVPTKLPHYVLPLMPAVAILTVLAIRDGAVTMARPGARWVAGLVGLIPAALVIGLLAAAWTLDRVIPVAALPVLIAACVAAALASAALIRNRVEAALCLAILASALLSPAVFGLTQPALAALKVSPRLAAIRDGLPCPSPRVASLGYREPSLVFLIGADFAMLNSGAEAAAFLKAGGCRLVFVESRFSAEFAAASVDAAQAPVATVSGFNINSGRKVVLSAYAMTP